MKRYISLFYFHKKIVIPAIAISGVLALFAVEAYLIFFGIAYFLSAPLMHYFIYEIGNPNEYYFYYNLGFSKFFLWSTTIISAVIVALIFRII